MYFQILHLFCFIDNYFVYLPILKPIVMKRNLNKERFPDLVERRVCNECNVDKCLTDFAYHISNDCFSKTCQECINEKKRLKGGCKTIIEDGKIIPLKKCNKCGVDKYRTEENYSYINKKGGYRQYRKVCIECMKTYQSPTPLQKNRNIIPEEDKFKLKTCNKCKKEISLSDYYYSWHNQLNKPVYSSICIKCESDRKRDTREMYTKEERESYLEKQKVKYQNNIHSHLLRTYSKFDFERNLETDVTLEYIIEQSIKPCTYCSFKSTGLDRIDNNIGHTIENCVPCCSECNSARMNNFSHEEMFTLGLAIKQIKENRINNHTLINSIEMCLN